MAHFLAIMPHGRSAAKQGLCKSADVFWVALFLLYLTVAPAGNTRQLLVHLELIEAGRSAMLFTILSSCDNRNIW